MISTASCQIRIWYHTVNQPPIIANATFFIPLFSSNSTIIGRVFAVDPDHNQQLTFSLSSRIYSFIVIIILFLDSTSHQNFTSIFSQFFSIHPHSGEIVLIDSSLFNHTNINLFSDFILLMVTVCDNGIPPLHSSYGILIFFSSLELSFIFTSHIPFKFQHI